MRRSELRDSRLFGGGKREYSHSPLEPIIPAPPRYRSSIPWSSPYVGRWSLKGPDTRAPSGAIMGHKDLPIAYGCAFRANHEVRLRSPDCSVVVLPSSPSSSADY